MNLEEIAIRLQEAIDRTLRNEGRIKKLEGESEALHSLATSVAVMAEQLKEMNKSVSRLTGEVEELKEKPAKRWDSIVGQIVAIIVAAALGYLLSQFGL
jgi:uncharacterized protein YoxC